MYTRQKPKVAYTWLPDSLLFEIVTNLWLYWNQSIYYLITIKSTGQWPPLNYPFPYKQVLKLVLRSLKLIVMQFFKIRIYWFNLVFLWINNCMLRFIKCHAKTWEFSIQKKATRPRALEIRPNMLQNALKGCENLLSRVEWNESLYIVGRAVPFPWVNTPLSA